MRILLVEDDEMLGEALQAGLSQGGYLTDWIKDGPDALLALRTNAYEAVILDINLPGISGFDVLRTLRTSLDLPVIIMTARDGVADRIEGLDLGADDYVVKPFALGELLARLRAVQRRSHGRANPTILFRDIELDTSARAVRKGGNWVKMRAREYQILELLMQRVGRVVSKSEIEQQIYSWNDDFESNTVEATIYTLRKKLGKDLITTLRGIGYVINP
ncbi:response regulator transcription factor [Asticcacaulis sp. EMRT-3]|uniref:response regulator transcription factor n=1 Tax=Asticcacaulis sp. EMRT-3 TaxID=3040349 RepID=UPI0024AF55A4|nr:response regulator transcription factor [Asticcacaulis sp. EMRT-3]MDI7774762.1 response regulator transcription factor [Asticcacaulis sp. EMRT-3]